MHVAFTAGTGVLPFLDLVAYLIRLNLDSSFGTQRDGQKDMSEIGSPFPGINLKSFKFVLYVSYKSKDEAIGRDLCLGLKTIVKTMKRDNFEYYERFSLSSEKGLLAPQN